MNEFSKTLTFVAAALVLSGAAYVTTRDRTVQPETFNDQGQPFLPDLKDPLACTDLEVVDYDSSTATPSRFRVMFKNNRWVIPSHYDYPADARDRLSKTAAAVMDLVKDTIRSDSTQDHEEMGVIDPLDSKTTTLKGRGKRITLRDASETVIADLIIGNEVKERTGQRFVRKPDEKRTYGVRIKAEPSTRFADWIETNLLKLEASHIRKIEFDNYKVSLDQGYQRGELLTIERKDSSSPWTMAGLSEDKELDSDKLRTLTDALADLKIVGVRTKPAGLTRDLKKSDKEGIKLAASTITSLQSKGFFLTREGQLLSNQGDVRVYTDEGVVYTLRFGEIVFGTGDELTAGAPDDSEKVGTPKDKEAAKKPEGTAENRFVMVTTSYDPALISRPKPESDTDKEKAAAAPGQPLEVPANPFAPDPSDPKVLAQEKEAKEKADRDQKDYEKKLADGKKRAEELTDRFAAWYYVTPGDSFRSINLDRTTLVRPKKADAAGAPGAPGGLPPGFPGGGSSLPGGLPPIQP